MKNSVAIINTCDWGSTGRIAKGLQQYLKNIGVNTLFCYGRGEKRDDEDCFRFCTLLDIGIHFFHTHLTGILNSSSRVATERLVKKLRQKGIRSIYIINLHGYILNEELFLDYLVNDDIRVVYIMADESAFLGNCTYRDGCEEFVNGCKKCNKVNGVSKLVCPNASVNAFQIKKGAYDRLKKITFVGPEFVVNAAKQSPLMTGKRMEVVDEAIDVRVNKPCDTTLLRKKLKINDEQIVIVCIAPFSYSRKGVKYLVEAAKRLENNSRFVFVQVGYDVKDKSGLPKNYIPIGYINNQQELTAYYSLADLFVFPSLQDTMPNACLDALACGSPLLCFNISGMPYIADNTVMTLVEAMNVDQMVDVFLKTKKKDESIINTCRNYALKRYDNQKYFEKLVSIMNSMNNN